MGIHPRSAYQAMPNRKVEPDVPHVPAPPPHPAGRRRLRRCGDVRALPPGRRSGPGRHYRHGHEGPRHGDADQRERRPGEPPAHGLQRSRHRLQHTRFGAGRVRVRPARRRGQVRRRHSVGYNGNGGDDCSATTRRCWSARTAGPETTGTPADRVRTGSAAVSAATSSTAGTGRTSATPRPSPPASSTSRRRRRSVSPDGDLVSPPPAVLRRHRHPGSDDRRVPIVTEERHRHRGEGGDR